MIPESTDTLNGVEPGRRSSSSPRTSRTPGPRSSCSTCSGQASSAMSSSPGIGTASRLRRQADRLRDLLRLHHLHRADRRSIRYDMKTGASTVFKKPTVKPFDPDDYETKQVFYPSKDGTKMPDVRQPQEGAQARRHEPDLSLRLRRVQHLAHARLQPGQPGLDGAWRRLRPAQPPRRRRVRRKLASGRDQAQQAKRLRRLHRRRRVADRQQSTPVRPSSPSAAGRTAACWSAPA